MGLGCAEGWDLAVIIVEDSGFRGLSGVVGAHEGSCDAMVFC